MVSSRIDFFLYILCFVCGSQSRCSWANAEQRLKIVGLVGGGSGSGMQQNSVQLSRDYLFYFTKNKQKTHQKTSLYYNNRKEQQKNIVARLQRWTSEWLLENELDSWRYCVGAR